MTDSSRTRKRRILLFVLLFLVVGPFICFAGWLVWEEATNAYYIYRLKVQLDEELPDGSTEEQAKAWLASHGFSYCFVLQTSQKPTVGIRGGIRNSRFLNDGEIRIDLDFGPSGLTKREVSRVAHPS